MLNCMPFLSDLISYYMYCRQPSWPDRNSPDHSDTHIDVSYNYTKLPAGYRTVSTSGSYRYAVRLRLSRRHDRHPIHTGCYLPAESLFSKTWSESQSPDFLFSMLFHLLRFQHRRWLYLPPWRHCCKNNTLNRQYSASPSAWHRCRSYNIYFHQRLSSLLPSYRSSDSDNTRYFRFSASLSAWHRCRSYNTSHCPVAASLLPWLHCLYSDNTWIRRCSGNLSASFRHSPDNTRLHPVLTIRSRCFRCPVSGNTRFHFAVTSLLPWLHPDSCNIGFLQWLSSPLPYRHFPDSDNTRYFRFFSSPLPCHHFPAPDNTRHSQSFSSPAPYRHFPDSDNTRYFRFFSSRLPCYRCPVPDNTSRLRVLASRLPSSHCRQNNTRNHWLLSSCFSDRNHRLPDTTIGRHRTPSLLRNLSDCFLLCSGKSFLPPRHHRCSRSRHHYPPRYHAASHRNRSWNNISHSVSPIR